MEVGNGGDFEMVEDKGKYYASENDFLFKINEERR
jgi:hypothetical protein